MAMLLIVAVTILVTCLINFAADPPKKPTPTPEPKPINMEELFEKIQDLNKKDDPDMTEAQKQRQHNEKLAAITGRRLSVKGTVLEVNEDGTVHILCESSVTVVTPEGKKPRWHADVTYNVTPEQGIKLRKGQKVETVGLIAGFGSPYHMIDGHEVHLTDEFYVTLR